MIALRAFGVTCSTRQQSRSSATRDARRSALLLFAPRRLAFEYFSFALSFPTHSTHFSDPSSLFLPVQSYLHIQLPINFVTTTTLLPPPCPSQQGRGREGGGGGGGGIGGGSVRVNRQIGKPFMTCRTDTLLLFRCPSLHMTTIHCN